VTIGDISAVAAMLAHQAGTLYFSRDMEEEADRLGLLALQRAQIRPDGMLRFFQKLDDKDKTAAGLAVLAPANDGPRATAAQPDRRHALPRLPTIT
jgi:predicted Zn-dependent protease